MRMEFFSMQNARCVCYPVCVYMYVQQGYVLCVYVQYVHVLYTRMLVCGPKVDCFTVLPLKNFLSVFYRIYILTE